KETVTVSASRRQTDEGERVEFVVADTGIGMTAEQVGRLFQEFFQADSSTTSKYGGTGLGPAVSRRLFQVMGGVFRSRASPGGDRDSPSPCRAASATPRRRPARQNRRGHRWLPHPGKRR